MGKQGRQRSLADNEARAVARNLRVSPQKLNLVAGLIRGKKVDEALSDLRFSHKRIAEDVRKCVMSAVANAENNHGLDVNALVVKEAWVGKNLVMKRFAARGRGRGFRILKPFSQITVVVREAEAEAERSEAKAKAGTKTRAEPKPKTKAATKSKAPARAAKSPAEGKAPASPKAGPGASAKASRSAAAEKEAE
jgi:large subunit ribosomal protein L22